MNESEKKTAQENSDIARLRQELEDAKKRAEDYLARLKYVQADFENLKKRAERQLYQIREYCTEPLVVELLEIVDELELAVKAGCNSKSAESVTQGVEMTLKKLKRILENDGVSPIESIGKPFDPSRHNAIAKVERDDVPDCTVVEEVRKGYMMKEKVIRPSLVKVAVKPESQSQTEVKEHE